MDVNEVTLLGRATKDPEQKETPGGTRIANFSVATGRKWKNSNDELQEDTQFTDIVCFENLAKICSDFLKKGHRVYVRGRLKTRSWEEKETGNKRYKTEVIASEVILLEKKEKTESAQQFESTEDIEMRDPPHDPLAGPYPSKRKSLEQDDIELEDVPF